MSAVDLIREERRRQRSRAKPGEAHSLSHDDHHTRGELARAAAVYACPPEMRHVFARDPIWPFGWRFKPDARIRELVKAGALIAAEIDRLERLDTQASV